MKLLNGATANGTYPALQFAEDANIHRNQTLHWFYASGTINGATIVVQISPDGLNIAEGGSDTNAALNANSRWFNLADTIGTISALPAYGSSLAKFRKARAVVSGAGASTNVTLEVVG